MADYHTVYRRPEGETTQWEDIQVKMGNLAPRPAKHKPPAYEGEAEVSKRDAVLRAQGEDELCDLEDDVTDDRELEIVRARRLAQLRNTAKQEKCHAAMDQIRRSDFQAAVTDASHDAWVVVLLYKDDDEGCAVLTPCLECLAQRYQRTRFVKIISTECIPNFPDGKLPTVLVYHKGQCARTFAGLTVWGGKRASAEQAALVLNKVGPICRGDAEANSGGPSEQEVKELIKRVVLQHQDDEDEGSDFDDV